jgi:REP element-mobilizing transposase RayT
MDHRQWPDRRSIRLREFDYTQNAAYFVTVCAAQRRCLFGEIVEGEVLLSPVGKVVNTIWQEGPSHFPGLVLNEWVVMPNHFHGIIVLPGTAASDEPGADQPRRIQPRSLGVVIGGFKSAVSRRVAADDFAPIQPIWQRNYYERVIRNDRELDAIRQYIAANPAQWENDPEYSPQASVKATRRPS